jgi:3-hydroxymyristoyl/3-hydroxydecanoyl-(acyl carrier protein) dehydratase
MSILIEEASAGERISKLMSNAGMTQAELAERLAEPGMSAAQIENVRRNLNKWLSGKHLPSRRYARRLAEIFPESEPDQFLSPRSSTTSRTIAVAVIEDEALALGWQMANSFTSVSSDADKDSLPDRFCPKEQIESLAPYFDPDHVLLDEVLEWERGSYCKARSCFDEKTLRLGSWFRGSPMIPGMLIVEALTQAACLAILTEPRYRLRHVIWHDYEHVRMSEIVTSGSSLLMIAELRKAVRDDRIAVFDTRAFKEEASKHPVARARVALVIH